MLYTIKILFTCHRLFGKSGFISDMILIPKVCIINTFFQPLNPIRHGIFYKIFLLFFRNQSFCHFHALNSFGQACFFGAFSLDCVQSAEVVQVNALS